MYLTLIHLSGRTESNLMEHVYIKRIQNVDESPAQFSSRSIAQITQGLSSLLEEIPGFIEGLSGHSVLIKPNLVRPFLDKLPCISTDPRVILSLVQICRDAGASEIYIGDNPGYGLSCRKAYLDSRLEPYLSQYGVRLRYFDEEEFIALKPNNPLIFDPILVAKAVLESDVFINLPKMKTHILTQVSLGIKNLLGIIPDSQRLIFHRADINAKIVDILQVAKPNLTIIDGLLALQGQAPLHGSIRDDMPLFIAGMDTVAVDAIASYLMGFDGNEITSIALASRLGLGESSLDNINTHGFDIDENRRFFKRAVLSSSGRFKNIDVAEYGACMGCLSAIRHALDKLEFEGLLDKIPPQHIYVGIPMPDTEIILPKNDEYWCFGDCASALSVLPNGKGTVIPGCAPHIFALYNALRDKYRI